MTPCTAHLLAKKNGPGKSPKCRDVNLFYSSIPNIIKRIYIYAYTFKNVLLAIKITNMYMVIYIQIQNTLRLKGNTVNSKLRKKSGVEG